MRREVRCLALVTLRLLRVRMAQAPRRDDAEVERALVRRAIR